MAPIPVLYVNHVSFISGAEKSLLALLQALDRDRIAPILACPDGDLAAQARAMNVDVVPIPITSFRKTHNPLTLSSYALNWLAGSGQFKKIAHSAHPKLIHANSAMAYLYAGPAARKAGVPCLWHARDLAPLPFPASSVCRNADCIIAISQCVADFLCANGFSRLKVTTAANGIDADAWRAQVTGRDIRSELGLGAEERLLLMAAQMTPWKRHEDAIRAMPPILERCPAARLLLAGADLWGTQPEYEAHLRALAQELGVADEVLFTGYREDIADLMDAAEVVLAPSDAEPFGRVALEAMALGKPVVGTRAGGLPEVVRDGETGLLVVPRFPESLAEAVVSLLENPGMARRLGEAGRKRVENRFNMAGVLTEIRTVYDRLVAPSLRWLPA